MRWSRRAQVRRFGLVRAVVLIALGTLAMSAASAPMTPPIGAYDRGAPSAVAHVVIATEAGTSELGVARAVGEVLADATPGKARLALQFEKTGGFARANADFDRIAGGADVLRRSGGMRTAQVPGGSTLTVRPFSGRGLPTLDIRTPGNPTIKIRYSP